MSFSGSSGAGKLVLGPFGRRLGFCTQQRPDAGWVVESSAYVLQLGHDPRRNILHWARIANFRIWNLNRIFGVGPNFRISDGLSESLPNFERLVLGAIDADFCKQIFVGKLLTRSTQCTPLHRSSISRFQPKIVNIFNFFRE